MSDARIEALTQTALAFLEKLVGFDSVSRNPNLPIILFIQDTLTQLGIESTPLPAQGSLKSNLLARIGPSVPGGIVLSGHTDVVPVDGQQWDSDPFVITERDGKLFGRGTADMKSFIAVCLALAPEFRKLNLQKPIWFAFSYDEEVGCLGAPHLLEHIEKHIPKPEFALIGEPTLMQVVTAHKGVLSFETTVHGLEFHSSQPQMGVNAVQIASELVTFLAGIAKELMQSGKRDPRFTPPYSTVHVGTISGGTARNIIPKECHFHWEIRPLPGENTDSIVKRFDEKCASLKKEIQAVYAKADIVTKPMSHMLAVTLPPAAENACQRVMHAAQTNQQHAVSFGTEAGVFQHHGIPAIICGPGSIEQAHKPNEFIEVAQIQECISFLLRLVSGDG